MPPSWRLALVLLGLAWRGAADDQERTVVFQNNREVPIVIESEDAGIASTLPPGESVQYKSMRGDRWTLEFDGRRVERVTRGDTAANRRQYFVIGPHDPSKVGSGAVRRVTEAERSNGWLESGEERRGRARIRRFVPAPPAAGAAGHLTAGARADEPRAAAADAECGSAAPAAGRPAADRRRTRCRAGRARGADRPL